ncbi:alkyl/aryl-sulfatase [Desulfosediminicola flagellatus]|uniref:alkyl/aryl-sulfatase n=1 Tax=Desulfosediminicola flagellatus TaxID=2569541 RepID=UPI00142E9931|nr:alkyl/aryl-sulfatase [Desulfosediminicola flagellatus]
MKEHAAKMFKKEVLKVGDNVYVAVGHAASVASMIIGDDGVIIIDTTQSIGSAEGVLESFRKITDKPIKAIIYTHGHRDHISGTSVFTAEGSNPEIIARSNLINPLDDKNLKKVGPYKILQKRTIRQYGIKGLEPHTEKVSMGLGPASINNKGLGKGFVAPTRTFFDDNMEITVSGVKFELYKAPGETNDQLFVWMPEEKILFSGDNFYQTFPNLYAIRGTVYRDFSVWADSLDHMTQFPIEHLVPGHTRPISGPEANQALADYRDAIRYIVEKTAEGMNKGLTPDELVSYVTLPKNLTEKYYLNEFLGTVDWSVRAYFAGTLGWFDGNPTHLFPTVPREKAQRLANMAGGEKVLFENMNKAVSDKEFQWAMELADMLMLLEKYKKEATAVKITALKALADQQRSAIGRNYYLVYAKELAAE